MTKSLMFCAGFVSALLLIGTFETLRAGRAEAASVPASVASAPQCIVQDQPPAPVTPPIGELIAALPLAILTTDTGEAPAAPRATPRRPAQAPQQPDQIAQLIGSLQ